MQRASGILLHPTALPGALRIGDLGEGAYSFVDFLASSGQSIWQVLPLGPTGYGHSPYNALSAFAGNPILIDLQQLVDCGDLDNASLSAAIGKSFGLDFNRTHALKKTLLLNAGQEFLNRPKTERHQAFASFCRQQSDWLEDFCLFMALRDNFAEQAWSRWPEELRIRKVEALAEWRVKLANRCELYKYQQFVFAEQWRRLKCFANGKGIRIFGDIPIFVAYDSVDVWANQTFFQLDEQGRATAVAGVPPDYFSTSGQRWGNPLYRWDKLAEDDFHWWLRRFAHQLKLSDMIRIDHFRGFQACWSIPASETTAMNGHWEEVPGRKLFEHLCKEQAKLPIIAEDLGVITPDVEKLRDDFGFPGMKILQFAFDSGPDNPYLPENHCVNSVVYTGTHDNNTTLGWWQGLAKEQKNLIREYLGTCRPEIPWDIIRLAMASTANLCIIPCQDILALGETARFNTPGRATGNWSWQVPADGLTEKLADFLLQLTEKYQRVIDQ